VDNSDTIPPAPDTDPRPKFDDSDPPRMPPTLESVDAKLDKAIFAIEGTRKDVERLVDKSDVLARRLESTVNPIGRGTRAALVFLGAALGGVSVTVVFRILGISTIAAAAASCLGIR
jgi:hypothetical protein